jgi:peptidoglycan/xylan/chitin deacetylase (PgdA/CDA1 family)
MSRAAGFLPVLTFHTLDDRPSPIAFPRAVFRHGLARLHAADYRTLSLLEAVALLQRGAPFPARAFVLTFDDGYQTVYDEAFPVLQRFGMSATVFLTVGRPGAAGPRGRLPSLNGRAMLAWPQIQEMQRWGIHFGAHTLTHPDLTRLPPAQVRAEACESRAIIESALGTRVACFAYPYGRHDHHSREVVRQHFDCACTDTLGLLTARSDRYRLDRVDAYYLRTVRLFAGMRRRGWLPWYVWARGIPRRIRRAVQGSPR